MTSLHLLWCPVTSFGVVLWGKLKFFYLYLTFCVILFACDSAPRSPLMPHSPVAPLQAEAQPLGKPQGAPAGSGTMAVPQPSPDKYQIMVDVSHFSPEEITVKTVDNTIVVIGKHEDKADNYGYVSRQFSRKYLLPADVEPETVTSTLSADGVLSIQAPRKPLQIKDTDGRAVPIAISNQMLSPVHNMSAPQFPSGAPPPANTNIPVTSEQSVPPAQQAPPPAAPAPPPQ